MFADIKSIQTVEFEILKRVKEICDKHNLKYFLAYGTLLGAVRHGGFIPWDDDIDIIMPADDYAAFNRIAGKELSPEYFLQSYSTDFGHTCTWTKVRKNNTTSMPVAYMELDIHWGICIDIFPMISTANEKQRRVQDKLCYLFSMVINREQRRLNGENTSLKTKLLSYVPECIVKVLASVIEKRLLSYNDFNGPTRVIAGDAFDKATLESNLFFDGVRSIAFEGEMFSIPPKTEEMLTSWYGDYMKLPPEEERGGHTLTHGEIIFDCNRDFRFHKNKSKNNTEV